MIVASLGVFLYECCYWFSFILFITAFNCWASFWRMSFSVPIILLMVIFCVVSLNCGDVFELVLLADLPKEPT